MDGERRSSEDRCSPAAAASLYTAGRCHRTLTFRAPDTQILAPSEHLRSVIDSIVPQITQPICFRIRDGHYNVLARSSVCHKGTQHSSYRPGPCAPLTDSRKFVWLAPVRHPCRPACCLPPNMGLRKSHEAVLLSFRTVSLLHAAPVTTREAQAATHAGTSAAASTAPTRCSRFSSLFVRTFGHDNNPPLPRSHARHLLTSRGRLGSRWRPQCLSRHPCRRPDRFDGTDADQCVISSSAVNAVVQPITQAVSQTHELPWKT